jgi:hypothetical protein
MSSFLTQSVNQNLKILLLSQGSTLASAVNHYLQNNQIQVFEIITQDLTQNSQTLEKIQKEEFYKIIWIYGFNGCLSEEYQLIGKLLKQRKEPKLIISKALTPIKTQEKIFSNWKKEADRLSSFNAYIGEKFSESKTVCGLDVVMHKSKLDEPIRSTLLNINLNEIINPNLEVRLQSSTDFFKVLKKQMFKPVKEKMIVRGSKINFLTICQKIKQLHQRYYQSQLKIVNKSVKSKRVKCQDKWIKAEIKVDLDQIIDHQVRLIPDYISIIEKDRKELGQRTSRALKTEVVAKGNQTKNKSRRPKKPPKIIKESVLSISSASTKSEPKENVDHELRQIFTNDRVEKKVERRVKKASIISKIRQKTKHKKLVFWIGLIVVLIGAFLGANLGVLSFNYKKSQQEFIKLTQNFKDSDTPNKNNLLFLDKQTQLLGKIFDISIINNSQNLIKLYQKISKAQKHIQDLSKARVGLYQRLFGKNDQELTELIPQLTQSTEKLYQELSLLQAELKTSKKKVFNPQQQQQLKQFEKELIEYRKELAKTQKLNPLLSQLLAKEDKRNYLIILQDNQEIRPTGGFIQAVASATLKRGQVIDDQIINVNEIDSQLSGKIDAPSEVKTLLGEENLYLRDANWDPDFPSTANRISWFYKQTVNKQVDGVIGINYFLVKELLKDWGELTVVNYEEKITANNLFERLNYHANEEKDQELEQNFQVSVLETVLNKLKTLSKEETKTALNTLAKSLENKETLFVPSSEEIAPTFEALGWTGSIVQPNCPGEFNQATQCLIDSVYQVEANVGINKVNPYVSRKVTHELSIKAEDKISHLRKISFNNKAKSKFWPLGTYKLYLRLYFTPEAKMNTIKLDGKPISKDKIVSYLDHNKKVVGTLIEVPSDSKRQLIFNYTTPFQVNQKDSYMFFDQNQPGVEYEANSLIVKHSSTLTPELVAPQADVEDNLILFDQEKNSHNFVGLHF